MKYTFIISALSLMLVYLPAAQGQTARSRLTTVSSVDLRRYAGRWYEIGRYPNRFEKSCIRNVTADYSIRSDGDLRVVNTCIDKKGKKKIAEGEAKVTDGVSNSKLKVRFAPSFLKWLPFVWGDYWIVDLDPNYRYALVGDRNRRYFWILSREAQMDTQQYEALLKRAEAKGFDPSKVIRVQQAK